MIFTRRFGALAARPQFPDSPELEQELAADVDHDATAHDHADPAHEAQETAA